jgi:restriction endonuclease Mrr
MIPSRKEAKPVILDYLSDRKPHTSDEIQEMIATYFALTPEERERRRGKGPHPVYVNETAWALVDLQKDGLIKKIDPDGFVYRITDSGKDAARKGLLGTPIPRREPR